LINEFFTFFEKVKNETSEINNTEDGSLLPFDQWKEIHYEGKINIETINKYLDKMIINHIK